MESAVVAFRNEILDAMVEFGLDVDDGRLDLLAAFVSSILDAEPMLGSLGELDSRSQPRASVRIMLGQPALRATSEPQSPALSAPQLIAVIRQYGHSSARAGRAGVERNRLSFRPSSSVSGKTHSLR